MHESECFPRYLAQGLGIINQTAQYTGTPSVAS
jgi:hypothetical protein